MIGDEPDADEITTLLVGVTGTTMSTATYVRTSVVVDGALPCEGEDFVHTDIASAR